MTRKQKAWQLMAYLMMAMLSFSSCNEKQDDYGMEYLPVQMSKGDSWSIIDKEGKVVVEEEYPSDAQLSSIRENVYWVKSGEKYQLYNINNPKKPVTEEEFTQATAFEAGVAAVSNPNQPIRIIGTDGRTIATLGKDIKKCYSFNNDGYSLIENVDGKSGLIDTKGRILIRPTYLALGVSSDGLLIGIKSDDDKILTILDTNGKKLGGINLEKYDLMSWSYHEGKIIVKNKGDEDGNCIILDKTGKKLFDIKKAKKLGYGGFYKGGYLTFANNDDKYGVADDKGEIVIRPKYEDLWNFGNGHFAAKKGDKWGIVNEKDEMMIDFDYDDYAIRMGENYVMKDGSTYSMIGMDGKEITSFDEYSYSSNYYVEYVDVEGLANGIYKTICEYENAPSALHLAKMLELDIENYHYSNHASTKVEVEGKLTADITTWYNDYMAKEETHQVEENDGWFTYTRTVSDGWKWTDTLPSSISGTLKLSDNSLNIKDLYKALTAKMSGGRKAISDGLYSKEVKVGGKVLSCQTNLTLSENDIYLEIKFAE